jgi:SNF2 family DNA or RNA helicase
VLPLPAGEKVLVFGHHQAVLDALQEELRGRRVPHVRIDGQVGALPGAQRAA